MTARLNAAMDIIVVVSFSADLDELGPKDRAAPEHLRVSKEVVGAFPLVSWQVALRAWPTSASQIRHSLWSRGPVAQGAPRASSRALSPDCRSTPWVMLWWLGLVFLARASSHILQFCACSSPHRQGQVFFFF